MKYYWENLIDAPALKRLLCSEYEIVDTLGEPGNHEGMKRSYPTYVQRQYRIYQNGNCIGHTTKEALGELNIQAPPVRWYDDKLGKWITVHDLEVNP